MVSLFVARLPHVRQARGLSALQLASMAAERGSSLDRAAISKIENGARRVLLVDALVLCDALDVPLTGMLSEEPVRMGVLVV